MKYLGLFFTLLLITSCYDPSDYDNVEFDPLKDIKYLYLKPIQDSIPADGRSTIEVIAVISKSTKPEFREIEFSTTKGLFVISGTKSVKIKANEFLSTNHDSIVAKAVLRSEPNEGTATITARVSNLEQTKSIKFSRAESESIFVETTRFFVYQYLSSEDTIIAKVSRNIGTPTSGQKIDYLVINSFGDTIISTKNRIGYYKELKDQTNDTGTSSVIFSVGDPMYIGKLKIIAAAEISNNKTIKDSTYIEVIN